MQSGRRYLWQTGECCGPLGFGCTDDGRVTEVRFRNLDYTLTGFALRGPVPDLSALSELRLLELSGHQLSGGIAFLEGLSKLQILYLYNNNFDGNLPPLSRFPHLREVALYNNKFSGRIPSLEGLSNLTLLELRNNFLSGDIPPLSSLTNLKTLDLSNNSLTGPVPELWNLTQLKDVFLQGNNLTGNVDCRMEFSTLPEYPIIQCRIAEYDKSSKSNLGVYTCAKKVTYQCLGNLLPIGPPSICTPDTLNVTCIAGRPVSLSPHASGIYDPPLPTPTSSSSDAISTSLVGDHIIGRAVGGAVGGVAGLLIIIGLVVMRKKICPSKPPSHEVPVQVTTALPPFTPHMMVVTPTSLPAPISNPSVYPAVAPASPVLAAVPPPLPSIRDGSRNVSPASLTGLPAPPAENQAPSGLFAMLVGSRNSHLQEHDFGSNGPILAVDYDFTPTDTTHVAVSKGHLFKVRTAFRDGWLWGTNLNTDGLGRVPIDCVRVAQKTEMNASELAIGISSA
ncbi:L domain-like protein [Gonapodya prolifera JEL478]|uniref:L domain-like protein n=1 Tax=Gonapodya prolifera (strain JEL478) TaxID=1344416 RepID=A0A138ZZA3_GONPJ|nr:L domain-like protein [Gonapodya prolifera JEL478]|eukprot:KXS09834.1 L domain-like protein [Gonapodya prolifera JEL478]